MLACMKGISSIGAILILIVGLGMTGITIYGYMNSEIFLDDTNLKNTILGIMAGADAAVLIGSIFGICGLKKGNILLICIFQIFVLIFMIVFFALGISSSILPGQFFQGNCTDPANPSLKIVDQIVKYSDANLCLSGCPCALTTQSIENYYSQKEKDLINSRLIKNTTSGVKSTQQCLGAQNMTTQEKTIASAFGQVQTFLSCTGWCDRGTDDIYGLFYKFSDVNNGKPQSYCYETMKNKMFTYGNIIGLGAFITSGLLLLICLINICICCHPSRKGQPLRRRFVYIRNNQYARV